MKKLAIIFSVFFLFTFALNNQIVMAETVPQINSEGFYTINDLKLLPNISYKVRNNSPNKVFMIVFDGTQLIQQSIRFEPNSIQYVLRPMKYDYRIVVIGNGQLEFTT